MFIIEPQDDFFCFTPPSLAAKYEFEYIGIGLFVCGYAGLKG